MSHRNRMVVRQWQLLQTLQASHSGRTVPELASTLNTTTRTVYRDLEALQEVPFPLMTARHDDGNVRWQLAGTGGAA